MLRSLLDAADRDGVNPFEARGKAIKWLASELGFTLSTPSIHVLSREQCEQAIRYVAEFQAARQLPANVSPLWVMGWNLQEKTNGLFGADRRNQEMWIFSILVRIAQDA